MNKTKHLFSKRYNPKIILAFGSWIIFTFTVIFLPAPENASGLKPLHIFFFIALFLALSFSFRVICNFRRSVLLALVLCTAAALKIWHLLSPVLLILLSIMAIALEYWFGYPTRYRRTRNLHPPAKVA